MGTNRRSEVAMTPEEIATFLETSRILTAATIGPAGLPHLTAMWYGLIDGEIWFETKAKSQKAINLQRDFRITCMAEAGGSYDQLRGVSIEGTTEITEDYETLFRVGVSVWERYTGPYTEDLRPAIDAVIKKRVAIRVIPQRTRSWDHRKLGLPAMPLSGTTASPAKPA